MFRPRPCYPLFAACLLVLACTRLGAQALGITDGFPYSINTADTIATTFLPMLPSTPAGAQGFLQRDENGNFRFQNGGPVRFYGVTLQWTACFPDSADAIIMAARLRKLGVNLVRFQYMDNAFDWGEWGQQASFLDASTGFRTLHAGQMKRLDWFIHQLKQHGIYTYLILQSIRTPRPSDGLGQNADSALWQAAELNYLYPQPRAINKEISRLLLEHVNAYTGNAYRAEPAIAMIELADMGSIISRYRQGYTEYRPGQYGFSWRHSTRLDTLYAEFLKKKYGSKQTLANAWRATAPPGGFPDLIREGSFEGDFDRFWTISNGDDISLTRILSQGDSVPQGDLSLTLRVRNAKGNIYSAVMLQTVPLEFNTLYRLSFKAKCNNPAGRRLLIIGYQDGGLSAGLNGEVQITPYWKEQEIPFLVPVSSTSPFAIAMWFGDAEGDLMIDDVQLRAVEGAGLQPAEMPENALVVRIPWGHDANALVTSKRMEDQSEFYMSLEQDYLQDIYRYVSDTVGAQQPVAGAGHYWASGYMEAAIQKNFDFSATSAGWDWVSGSGDNWQIRNYSQLRSDWGGAINPLTMRVHRGQPYVSMFAQPYPNRYQAESMIMLPAYSLLQDWDGLVLDIYADDRFAERTNFIDTTVHLPFAQNPLMISLMPAASHIFRNGLLKPASTTISLRHSMQQARLLPRMEWSWGGYAVPGGMHGRAMLANRVVIDSTDAVYFTQRDDISFSPELEGEVQSDTREILWEYNRGAFSLDAPRVQGASGYLSRAGGFTLRNVTIDLLSANETATVLWVPVDTALRLDAAGRSLLILASRTEPTGWRWLDSTHADAWGAGPMLFDPMRVRLTFRPHDSVNAVRITPLDATGMPAGAPVTATRSGSAITVLLDQRETHGVWYGVEMLNDPSASVPGGHRRATLSAWPSMISDRSYITVALEHRLDDTHLEVLDALGRQVALLHAGAMESGEHSLRLDAAQLPAGPCLVRLRAGDGTLEMAKVMVVR